MTLSTSLRPWFRALLGGSAAIALALAAVNSLGTRAGAATTMPEFKHVDANSWINSAPLTAASLRGKVVLLEVYTSG